jgi:hypothetical protein
MLSGEGGQASRFQMKGKEVGEKEVGKKGRVYEPYEIPQI